MDSVAVVVAVVTVCAAGAEGANGAQRSARYILYYSCSLCVFVSLGPGFVRLVAVVLDERKKTCI